MVKINFHINECCNFSCKYCFRNKNIKCNKDNCEKVIRKIKELGQVDTINFVGGEPTLNKELLLELLELTKSLNLKSTIVTNGLTFSQDYDYLEKVCSYVECIGLSIDSLDRNINIEIGRCDINKNTLLFSDVKKIEEIVHKNNKKLKINIVANKYNLNDETLLQLKLLNIDKLKIFKNQKNNNNFGYITDQEFDIFTQWISNNIKSTSLHFERDMDDSYIMIDGRGFISCGGNPKEQYDFLKNPETLNKILNRVINSKNYLERIKDRNVEKI